MTLSAFPILVIAFLLCSLNDAASEEYYIVATDLSDSLVSSHLTLSQFAANSHYLHSNTTLFIQPGWHILSFSLIISDVDTFSMISSDSNSQIICDNQAVLYFHCKDLHIMNTEFIGCENNEVHGAERFLLEDVVFRGSEHGTALEITNTSAQFIRTTFVSNRGGKLQLLPEDLRTGYASIIFSKQAGSAVIAKYSNINISESIFEDNEAEIGGALFVENSIIMIQNTNFSVNYGICGPEVACCRNITHDILFHSYCNGYLGGVLFTYLSDITIEGSTFDSNSAYSDGGVVYSLDSNIAIRLCTFSHNFASGHGGVFNSYSSNITITASSFQYSTALGFGGVMSSYNDTVLLENTTFQDSFTDQRGGTVLASYSDIEISGCSFVANTARNIGGVLDLAESSVSIENSDFCFNNAYYSSGVLYGHGSNITVTDCTFYENRATVAAVLEANEGTVTYFYGSLIVNRNSGSHIMYFTASTSFFMGNSKFFNNNGSLMAFDSNVTFTDSAQFVNNTNNNLVTISRHFATSRHVMEGGALALFQSNLYFDGIINLKNNKAENTDSGAVHSIYSSIQVNGNVTIAYNTATGNGGGIYLENSELTCNTGSYLELLSNVAKQNGGGIYATGSLIKALMTYTDTGYVGTVIKFVNNTAEKGGGLSLEGSTKLYIMKYKTSYRIKNPLVYFAIVFQENTANYGGGIYMNDVTNTGACDSKQQAECFFQALAIHDSAHDRGEGWINTHNIHFIQNHANCSGSTLYGGLLDRCTISVFAEVQQLDKYQEGDENGLTYFNDISDFTNVSISSDPLKVCICTDNNTLTCMRKYDTPIEVKKGEIFILPVVAVDQAEQPVDAIIQSSLKHTSSGLGEGQLTRTASKFCTNLLFSITSPHESEELSLYAVDGPCKDADLSILTIEVQFLPCECPIGFQPSKPNETSCTCHCNDNIRSYVTCDAQSESFVRQLQTNAWISYDNTTGYLVYPNCPYDYCKQLSLLTSINLNYPSGADAQCGFNRSDLLCGSCQPGLSLSIGSSRCISCPSYWPVLLVFIVVAAMIAGVVLVAVLLILNMTVAMGTLNGLIFYANVLAANRSILLPFSEQNYITVLISWLNLELGLDTCFIEGMDTYTKTWLQLAFPTYVICLVVIVIIISSYSSKFSNLIGKKDPVATLATLILLSYAKLLEVIFKALAYANLQYQDGLHTVVWLPDATLKYFSNKHTILFIAVVLIMLIGLPYTILVFTWQWLLHLPDWRILKWTRSPKLQTFIEKYHTPYTARNRYWTGLLLLVRVILYLVGALNISNDPQIAFTSITFAVGCLLVLKGFFGRLYRKWPVDALETFFYFNLLLISVFAQYSLDELETNKGIPAYISVTVTLLALLLIILYHVYFHTSLLAKLHHTTLHVKLTRLFEQEYVPKPKHKNVGSVNDNINELMEVMDYHTERDTYESSVKCASTGPTHSIVDIPKPVLEPHAKSTPAESVATTEQ